MNSTLTTLQSEGSSIGRLLRITALAVLLVPVNWLSALVVEIGRVVPAIAMPPSAEAGLVVPADDCPPAPSLR